jgi:hypothetical protein
MSVLHLALRYLNPYQYFLSIFHNFFYYPIIESPTKCTYSVLFLNNQLDAPIIQICSVRKFYMFRASSLHIIRSFLLYIRHW